MGTVFEDVVFWVLAVASVAGALGVVLIRDVFRAALLLVVVFLAIAGIFVLLNAEFLAVVQVLNIRRRHRRADHLRHHADPGGPAGQPPQPSPAGGCGVSGPAAGGPGLRRRGYGLGPSWLRPTTPSPRTPPSRPSTPRTRPFAGPWRCSRPTRSGGCQSFGRRR